MNRGDSLAALEGLVGNHDHHHGQLVSPHMYVCMVLVTRNFTKSDEIRGNSARNPQSFCAAIRGIAVLRPRRVSPISAE